MKLALYLSLLLFALVSFSEKSSSLSNFQIKNICKKEKNKLSCTKNLKDKRYNLQNGNQIEIPVKPYKR